MTDTDTDPGARVPATKTPMWDLVAHAADRQARMEASREALSLITLPDLARPVPKLFVDLPWANREDAQADILARIIAADTLEQALGGDDELPDMDTYVGKQLVIWAVVARPGTIEEGWGAYISLDITVGDDPAHQVVNTSSAEVTVDVWRAYCEGRLPLACTPMLKGRPTAGRDQPIGLIVETRF
jgi:hypothetical protein